MADWNPEKYLSFADERAQPAQDLIARLSGFSPRHIADLGCGPGNSTAMLKRAFPDSEVIGYDASDAMIARARESLPDNTFVKADASNWQPGEATDLVFANALFQWIPSHEKVIAHILMSLKPGAVLAMQMPDSLKEPSHASMTATASYGPWAEALRVASKSRSPLLSVHGYHRLLKLYARRLDIWQTIYHHVLDGHQGIVDMFSSTGLKPFLDALNAQEKIAYLNAYKAEIAKHYTLMDDGKLLYPFPRLFILAVRA
jgi:trans-aconitate 2-methyltransferase